MNKKKIVEKIQKLLAMAGSKEYNENEAAVAASQAQKLLHKYNISLSEVEAKEVVEVDMRFFDYIENDMRYIHDWKIILSSIIEEPFNVKAFIGSDGGNQSGIRVIGGPADVEVAIYTFEFLVRTVEGLWKEIDMLQKAAGGHIKREEVINWDSLSSQQLFVAIDEPLEEHSYKKGIIYSLKKKFEKMVSETPADNYKNENAIIHIKSKALQTHIEDMTIEVRDTPDAKQPITDERAYSRGIDDGEKVEIRKGIN